MEKYYSKLNTNDKALLNLVANSLFDCNCNISYADIDLKSVWTEAVMQTVCLTAFEKIDFSKIEPELAFNIKVCLANGLASNTKVDFEHIRIHNILSQRNIPYTIIKGLSSALYYPDALKRSMGDVDFLINPTDIDKVDFLLSENGFKKIKDSHSNHYVYFANNCRYEMHFEVSGIPEGKIGEEVKGLLETVIKESCEVVTELGTIRVPSVFHQGLITILHMCHHLSGDGLGLRHVCDWAVFISKLSYDEYKNLFEKPFKKIGLWNFSSVLSDICINYLGCPFRLPFRVQHKDISYNLLCDILYGGNFGQKTPDRSHEYLILSLDDNNDTTTKSMLKQLIKSANNIVYSKWKLSPKFKFVLPLGWIIYGGRYIIRSIFGKRPKIRLKKIVSEAGQRKLLYEKLKLFTEECD